MVTFKALIPVERSILEVGASQLRPGNKQKPPHVSLSHPVLFFSYIEVMRAHWRLSNYLADFIAGFHSPA